MKQFKRLIRDNVWPVAVATASIALLFMLLWFRLGSLTHGNAAAVEVDTHNTGASLHAIVANPFGAPYTVLQYLVHLSGHSGITSLRLISTLFGVLAMVLFYFVARQWHSTRVALLATWLFISSSWYLHISRLGSPEVLWLVGMLAVVVILTPNRSGRSTRLALPSTLITLALLLYIPGMVWLVAAGVLLQRKNIREAWAATDASWMRTLSILASVALLVPLGYAFARTPMLLRYWLGLGAHFDPPLVMVRHLLDVPKSLFVSSNFDAAHWLGHLPLLSSFEIVMFVLGLYFYVTHFRAARTRLIGVLTLIAWLIAGIAGFTAVSLVVPVVYLIVAAGIAYILHQWLKVFPRNPVARSFGIGVVLFAVVLTGMYQTRSYFVAWRYNPDTRAAFHTKL